MPTAGSEYWYNFQQMRVSAEGFADPFFTNIIDGAACIAPGQTAIDLASGGTPGSPAFVPRSAFLVEGLSYRCFSGFVNSRWGKFPHISRLDQIRS